MKNIIRGAVPALLLAAFSPQASLAQQLPAAPNYGNFKSLSDNYRIGVSVFNPVLNQTQQRAFEQSQLEDITTYLDPTEIAGQLGAFYTNQSAVSEVFDMRGVPILAGYAQNSPALTLTVINPETGATLNDPSGQPCSFTYNNGTRQASFNQFDIETDSVATPTSKRILQCIERAWSQFSPVDPIAGNPYSLQGSMVRAALDLSQGDSLAELPEGANSSGDPWQVGGIGSTGTGGRFNITRIDLRINKGWRILEGNRARLKLDLPFSFTSIKGTAAYSGQVGLGLEIPLKEQHWSLEPRIAYGISYSGDHGSVGHMVQGSLASTYATGSAGRGRFIIGNMVGYSTTLSTPGDFDLNPEVHNLFFRNGVAYDLPLKMRVGGRGSTLRASYTFTNFTGRDLYNNNFHEGTLSFGIRGRENTPKAFRDVMRINFSTIQAKGYSAYTAGIGFRF